MPRARFDHRIARRVQQIEPPGKLRGNLRHEPLHHRLQVVRRIAALHSLRHPRKQIADRSIGIAITLEALSGYSVFAEHPERLRHVADFVDLLIGGRFGGKILRGEPRHDIAALDDRPQHALPKNEEQHAKEQQAGDAEDGFRSAAPQAGATHGDLQCPIGALVDAVLEPLHAYLNSVELAFVFGREEDIDGSVPLATLARDDRRLLLIAQRIRPVQRVAKVAQFIVPRAGIVNVACAILDAPQLAGFALVSRQVGSATADRELPRKPAEHTDILVDRRRRPIEFIALINGFTFTRLRRRGQQHRDAGSNGEGNGHAVCPIGDGRQAHANDLGTNTCKSVNL